MSHMQNLTVASTSNTLVLARDLPLTGTDEGRSFAFVSGLGGRNIRSQKRFSERHWASIYSATQNARFGALFAEFNFNGQANVARFYFKNINNVVIDSFLVRSTVDAGPPVRLTTSKVGQGSIKTTPAGGLYPKGSKVELSANGDLGWAFDRWELDLSGSLNPAVITMDGNKSVRAVFTRVPVFTVTTRVTNGTGTIRLSPPGGTYNKNTRVTATAVPGSNWKLGSWGGDLSGSVNPTMIIVDAHKSITASFTEILESELIEHNASGSKIEVNEGQTGAQSFAFGSANDPDYQITKIILRLSRDSGAPNAPLNVSLGTSVNGGTLPGASVNLPAARITDASEGNSFAAVEVVFAQPVGPLKAGTTYLINLSAEAPNGGKYYLEYSVSSTYSRGTYYKDGSNDDKDISFRVWGGPVGAGGKYTLTTRTVGQGRVSPPGGSFPKNTVVALTAVPASGWTFASWSGAATGTRPSVRVTMDRSKTVTATFVNKSSKSLIASHDAGNDKIEVNDGQTGSQSFRSNAAITSPYLINKIVLYLSRDRDAPDRALTVSIGTGVNRGTIAGSLATIPSSRVTNTSEGTSFEAVEVVFNNPVGPLGAGQRYFINLRNGSPNGKKYYLQYDSNSGYSGGTYYKDGSDDGKDARFQIWGQPAPSSNCLPSNTPSCASMRFIMTGGDPVPGNSDFAIELRDAPTGSPSKFAGLFLKLGGPGSGLAIGCGKLYAYPNIVPPIVVPIIGNGRGCNGLGRAPLPLPANPGLRGVSVTAQMLVICPSTNQNSGGIGVSNPVSFTIR